jgi:hypothetical protein
MGQLYQGLDSLIRQLVASIEVASMKPERDQLRIIEKLMNILVSDFKRAGRYFGFGFLRQSRAAHPSTEAGDPDDVAKRMIHMLLNYLHPLL